jgi:ABC-type dipeptide/oligopeptide/nickel transport system permease subunit
MSGPRILGLILLAAGLVFLIMGLNASDSLGERLHEGITGRYTDKTTWFIVGGIAALVGGGAMTLFGGRGVKA